MRRMNRTAKQLGMRDTVYKAPYGLDAAGPALDGRRPADPGPPADGRREPPADRAAAVGRDRRRCGCAAVNTMLGVYAGADGVKTGHTGEAGWCLAATRAARRPPDLRGRARRRRPGDPRPRDRPAAGLGLLAAAQRRRRARRARSAAGCRCRTAAPSTPASAKTLRLTLRPGERVRLRYRLAARASRRCEQGDPVGQAEVLVGDARGRRPSPLVAARDVAAPGLVDRLVVRGRSPARPLRAVIVRYPHAW